MRTALLPFGEPVFFDGKYKEDHVYPLYIQMITCMFKIKKNKIPTIQIKKTLTFLDNEYLETSGTEIVCLTLTNIDLKLFLDQYDVYNLDYVCGWKFKGVHGLFDKYIDKWVEVKNKATIEGNKGMRTLAKLMLNALYGKFATSLDVKSKIPFLGDDDIIHYKFTEPTTKDGVYLPMRCFYNSICKRKNNKN